MFIFAKVYIIVYYNECKGVKHMKYRKKPVIIEAIQYTGENIREMVKFIGKGIVEREKFTDGKWVKFFEIETLEGSHIALEGDYIIKGIKGEFYPCKPDIFEVTYEPVTNEIEI